MGKEEEEEEEEKESAGPIYPKGAARTLKGFSEGLQHGLSVLLHGPSPARAKGPPKNKPGRGAVHVGRPLKSICQSTGREDVRQSF